MHNTISQLIFPVSLPTLFEQEEVGLVGLKDQIWMQAGEGRWIFTPISGEWELLGKGATARYWVYDRAGYKSGTIDWC